MILEEYRTYFSPIDLHFARFMQRLAADESDELLLAALFVSLRASQGDTCLDIPYVAGKYFSELMELDENGPKLPEADKWIAALRSSPVVGAPGDYTPLVLDSSGRLYLHRYWLHEKIVAERVLQMSMRPALLCEEDRIARVIARLFPKRGKGIEWQRVACFTAATRQLCVISGGPGTGKTSTVVRILALLSELYCASGKIPAFALTAPTGKASRRLQEAVRAALETMDCSEEAQRHIPREASTVHRLIGQAHRPSWSGYGKDTPLPYDVVVVDECSMADVSLLSRLISALHPGTRLILVGDRDQLASVEAGAALGDICDTGNAHGYSSAFVEGVFLNTGDTLEEAVSSGSEPPLADSIVVLRTSYRFGTTSGIGELAGFIRDGNAAMVLDLFDSGRSEDVKLTRITSYNDIKDPFAHLIAGRFGGLGTSKPAEAFACMSEYAILCALRVGPFGSEALNRAAELVLAKRGVIAPVTQYYSGRPVTIIRNDYNQRLFNGDTGVILYDPQSGENRAYFQDAREGTGLRKLLPLRLPEHESAYAMTVHRSQGSEFDHVLVILPERYAPVLTRELLYTAVSRAKKSVEIWASEEVLEKTVKARIARTSGLREALWGTDG